ncbi:MFS transporter [archaeon]|jgi:MFS family permease|nr:MFS transporter [archaeon]
MHFIREYHLRSLFSRELFEIYFLLAMRSLSLSLIGIFLPLYLFVELAYSFNQVIYFYIAFVLLFGIGQFIATKVVSRFGTKHSMVASIPLLIIALIFTMYLGDFPSLFYLAALFHGMHAAFFWVGFHIDAVLQGKKRDFGKESAIISAVAMLPSVVGPIVGGLVLLFFSFKVLFVMSLFAISISFIPLLFSKEVYAKHDLDISSFFDRKHLKYFFGYFAQGVGYTAGSVFWPLFIFTILGEYISLGIYGTVVTLFMVFVTLVLGKFSDEGKKGIILRISAIFNSVFWIMKVFVSTFSQVFVIGSLRSVVFHGIEVPFLAKTYTKAKKKHIGLLLFRETVIRLGQLACLLLVLLVGKSEAAFVAAGLLSLVFLFFR